jgi:tetratricopeptide (TPR) repeat protein
MTANAASNLFNLFPTWGSYGYSSWGLTPVVSNTYYSNYVNPYYATPVAAAAQPSVTVYNYSQPLATAAATDAGANAAPAQIDASEAQFQSARDAFKAGNYDDALKLADQALTSVPGDTALHEFRALCLFALGRYTESSAVLYAVLTAGPGWSWSTMIGLYPDVETYTNQLRSLEGYVKQNPNSASGHFVLAYQYMTAGHKEAAASEFQRVATLEPKDQLSSKFVQVLAPAAADNQVAAEPPAPAENATAVADASQTDAKQPTPPPAALVGSWTAKPDDSLTITLAIANEGDFTWTVTPKQGKPQVIKGKALYLEGEMALTQEQGNPLVGKVETPDAGTMKFSLLGDDKAPALVFKKGA